MKFLTVVGYTLACVIAAFPLESQERPLKLPGASGPRVEILNKTVAGVEILDVAVESSPRQKDKEPTQVLPAGTASLSFSIRTKGIPAQGTSFSVEIVNQAGPVKREGYGGYSQVVDRAAGEAEIFLSPPSTEPYPAGSYRATILVSGTKVAVLNWSVAGGPTH